MSDVVRVTVSRKYSAVGSSTIQDSIWRRGDQMGIVGIQPPKLYKGIRKTIVDALNGKYGPECAMRFDERSPYERDKRKIQLKPPSEFWYACIVSPRENIRSYSFSIFNAQGLIYVDSYPRVITRGQNRSLPYYSRKYKHKRATASVKIAIGREFSYKYFGNGVGKKIYPDPHPKSNNYPTTVLMFFGTPTDTSDGRVFRTAVMGTGPNYKYRRAFWRYLNKRIHLGADIYRHMKR